MLAKPERKELYLNVTHEAQIPSSIRNLLHGCHGSERLHALQPVLQSVQLNQLALLTHCTMPLKEKKKKQEEEKNRTLLALYMYNCTCTLCSYM